eukprot:TRINITY_DN138_c3_g1_i1.p1 TRINITY_DN138_c3_g1~~TRINITY_DN138_c3_g1_i1.p1  ORF type:complete len:565 (+),score=273.73 TRINITY_DN138_c3_g1_i1:66-1697(+)
MSNLLTSFTDWARQQSPLQWAEHGALFVATFIALRSLKDVKLSAITKLVPGLESTINSVIQKEVDGAMKTMFPKLPDELLNLSSKFPKTGFNQKELLEIMAKLRSTSPEEQEKRFAYVYDSNIEGHEEFVKEAFSLFVYENALNPVAFPALRHFEVDIIQMTASLLNAPASAVGSVTSCGSESILCALKAYRDRARKLFPHITEPEIVAPETVHPAFEKGAIYFGYKIVHVDLDPITKKVDLKKYAAAIGPNTILLMASAPQYPHGTVDPIAEIGVLAQTHNLPFHVDACVGGFFLPWVEKLGRPVPLWDFRVPAVTSISADIHKYGYCPKGASALIYRSNEYRKHQFFTYTTWPGGLFISPSVIGSRNGGSIAAAWASLRSLGEEGFIAATKMALQAFDTIKEGITQEIPELKVLGEPHMSIISFASVDPKINILAVADVMKDVYGWNCERQQLPDSIHLSLMPNHSKIASKFVEDLKASIAVVRADPSLNAKGTAAMYGLVAKIPDNAIVSDFLNTFLSTIYDRDRDSSSSSSSSSSEQSS